MIDTDYWKMNDNNTEKAMKLLEQFAPVLAEFEKARENYGFTQADLLELMYNVNLVKSHGYGTVKILVSAHKVTLVEALIKTLKYNELEQKAKEE